MYEFWSPKVGTGSWFFLVLCQRLTGIFFIHSCLFIAQLLETGHQDCPSSSFPAEQNPTSPPLPTLYFRDNS